MATYRRSPVGTTLAVLLAALFLFAGGTKLGGGQMHVQQFVHWRYPLWFMYVVGVWEVIGGVLLLIPAATFVAAVIMAVDMAGAVYTTALRAGEPRTAIAPLVFLALLVFVAYARRPETALVRPAHAG